MLRRKYWPGETTVFSKLLDNPDPQNKMLGKMVIYWKLFNSLEDSQRKARAGKDGDTSPGSCTTFQMILRGKYSQGRTTVLWKLFEILRTFGRKQYTSKSPKCSLQSRKRKRRNGYFLPSKMVDCRTNGYCPQPSLLWSETQRPLPSSPPPNSRQPSPASMIS